MVDPALEVFDLCDRDGRPTGRKKLRRLVHRDGDWHRSFHCWVVTPAASIVLQRRAHDKETWGNLWDVSVGGHYSAGEGLEGGIREMGEELGLAVRPEQLVQVGWRREEYLYESGLIEREVQDIFFLLRDVALTDLRSEPTEVSAVALIAAASLARLAAGRQTSQDVDGGLIVANGSVAPCPLSIETSQLVPRADGYYQKAAAFARRLAAGKGEVARRRWW